jgi:hypothetical protein
MNMNRPIVVALLALIALTRLHGAGFEADIPFEFHAGTEILPPGTYSFTNNESSDVVSVTRIGTNARAERVHNVRLRIVTRLGVRPTSDEGTLVFDKVNGIRTQSEVWIPLIDGFLVHSTAEKEVHEIVRVVPRGTQVPKDK